MSMAAHNMATDFKKLRTIQQLSGLPQDSKYDLGSSTINTQISSKTALLLLIL